jgi:hypothetical protein
MKKAVPVTVRKKKVKTMTTAKRQPYDPAKDPPPKQSAEAAPPETAKGASQPDGEEAKATAAPAPAIAPWSGS